jgi:hypothetical protein
LHIPDFPFNLLSVSSITKSLNCRGWFDPSHCAFQDLGIGRILGTGIAHNGLYYLHEGSDEVAFTSKMSPCQELLLLQRRFGHPPFTSMSHSYPSLFNACPRESLICDAREFAKHTRVPYPSLGLRSNKPFDVIHSDVWGPCEVKSVSGHRWFVTFIDGFSRYTWLYLLKYKSDVFVILRIRMPSLKTSLATPLWFDTQTMIRSMLTRSLNNFLFLMVLNNKQLVLTLQNKMVLLNEKIGICLKVLILLCLQ